MDEKYGKGTLRKKWDRIINSIKVNYTNYFWVEERGHLADYYNENGKNLFMRPNQLIAAAVQ
ncbi:MAG: hypothetical protein IJA38_06465, partial [Bacteroidales bacterium]|nr:hypothetical protein [Bacteroidales bacterium]